MRRLAARMFPYGQDVFSEHWSGPAESKIEHVYVACCERDLRYTRCCVASIRRWYPQIPISLLKDENDGCFETCELEQNWDVGVFEGERPITSRVWSKLEPMLRPGRERCLILDSDIVFLGRVIDLLDKVSADFIVEAWGCEPELIPHAMFDRDALARLDPEFVFPGYTFNSGQLVATSGILKRSDFERFVTSEPSSTHVHPTFQGYEQGLLNYVLTKKAQRGELTLARIPFMHWGFEELPRLGPDAVRTGKLSADSLYPYLVHWAGTKHKLLCRMPNGRLLRHFERHYYSRISSGRFKRPWRSSRLGWQILTRQDSSRIRPEDHRISAVSDVDWP